MFTSVNMRCIYLLLLALVCSCGKKEPPRNNLVLSIKEVGDLATVEYTVTKIIKAQDNKTWYKIGDRKILMTCEAIIKAGIDLSQLNENNFSIDGKKITLRLPPPKIISLNIPPENIQVQYEEVSGLRMKFSSSERNALAVQAEHQIRNSIDSLGILPQAKANTALLMQNMLRGMGFEEINIVHDEKSPVISTP